VASDGHVVASAPQVGLSLRETDPERAQVSTTKRGTDLEPVPTWQALLDVSVWRTSRPWWLRVAASLVVKRLNR
jgi:hypothetical protein